MIKFETKIKNFSIPSDWSEIKFSDYLKLKGGNEIEAIEVLTGLNVVEMQLIDIEEITPYLSFLQEPIDNIEPNNFLNDIELPEDIGELSYEKKIIACRDLSDIETMVLTYSGLTEINNLDCYSVFSAYNFLLSQMVNLLKRDSEQLASKPTIEQVQAGIEMFDILEEFNTIDMIARNYNYSHKEVEQLPYNLIFLILLKQNISSKFESNYQNIMKQ